MRIEDYLIKLKNSGYTPKSILDIGANVGDFSKFCKKIFPECEILMIEGNENCEEDLKMTNMDYKISLLGDTSRIVKFHLNQKNLKCTGSSYYKEKTHHYENSLVVEKKLQKLDDIVSQKFDIIKIDTQGSELDIIKGGLCTIQKARYIIMEVSTKEYNIGSPTFDEVISYLSDIGFDRYEEIERHFWYSSSTEFNYGEIFQVDLCFYKN